jgi:hypothetical protein
MRDPGEGLTEDGFIRTGVSRVKVPLAFEPVIADAIAAFGGLHRDATAAPDAALLLYGSVATGMAQPGRSDVDLIAIGVDPGHAEALARELSMAYRNICREVAVGAAERRDYEKAGDEAYGIRVFFRHYCVPLVGQSPVRAIDFLGDVRAARGFNGDIRRALARWRQSRREELPLLARQIGRKTLLAAAGLVSIAESGWTTDRGTAAAHWRAHRPELASDLAKLLDWSEGAPAVAQDVADALAEDGVVSHICRDFADRIGLWDPP